jgi:branched-chain amino acid transport system substrate-binding protein
MGMRTRRIALLAMLTLVVVACGGGTTATTVGGEPAATTAGGAETTAGGAETTAGATDTTTGGTETTAGGEASGEPIIFAASLPLTGEFSIPGTLHRDGYQFCIDQINERGGIIGRPAELLVEDNRSDSEIAVTQYERFISVEGVDVLLGTFSSLLTFPTSAVAEQNGMVYPVPSGAAQRIWERGFQNMYYFQQKPAELTGETIINVLEYYQEQGVVPEMPASAAVVYGDDFFAAAIANGFLGGEVTSPEGEVLADLAPGYLVDAGIELVLDEQYPAGFTDWLTLANSIAQSGAEFLSISTASPQEAIDLINALRTIPDYQPLFIYTSQGAQAEFQTALEDGAEGITIHTVWHPSIEFEGLLAGEPYTNQEFIDGFTAAVGHPPTEDEAIPMAVCQGMEQAIIGAGSTDNAALSEWLRGRTEADPVKTIIGDFHWDEKGLPVGRDFLVNQWQGGELAFVFPVSEEIPGTTDLIYPKPEW